MLTISIFLSSMDKIDRDNITSPTQITGILTNMAKDRGVAAFSKFHYQIMRIIQDRLNFTVKYRNVRGWAGRVDNSSFRLGYLGVMQRNEVDLGASAIFNRLNRFREFDTVYQGWKFETSFFYKFTPLLQTRRNTGNFLVPFTFHAWFAALGMVFLLAIVWMLLEYIDSNLISKALSIPNKIQKVFGVPINIMAAVCQQGVDVGSSVPSRIIVLTIFVFSLVLYNYYTSSLVGGLLGNIELGPNTIDEIASSKLRVSFEDIGYNKVFFREKSSIRIVQLLKNKIVPKRNPYELPVYTHIEDAVPYLRHGGYAFHCEIVDAYPVIEKQFDANEICNLRVVPGLMDTELMNWVLNKNSQYTELFRIILIRSKEVGLTNNLKHKWQLKKPECLGSHIVYPADLVGTASALVLLLGKQQYAKHQR